jgi:hypothetical protein
MQILVTVALDWITHVHSPAAASWRMPNDKVPPEETASSDDDVRTKEARRIIEEYATALREAVLKFRKWFN